MEDIAEDGSLVGKIEISVGPLAERGELKLVLVGEAPFMMPDETINIITAHCVIVGEIKDRRGCTVIN